MAKIAPAGRLILSAAMLKIIVLALAGVAAAAAGHRPPARARPGADVRPESRASVTASAPSASPTEIPAPELETQPMNVGLREVALHDELQDARIRLRLVYPERSATPTEQRVGPYTLDVAVDAPVARPAPGAAPAARALPLLVISHGTGGSALVYRELALGLVHAGFVVALPDHPGQLAAATTRSPRTAANLENRPRHLREVIDAAFADGAGRRAPPAARRSASSGTRWAATPRSPSPEGAPPRSRARRPTASPARSRVEPDPRVKALVLLAPATVWFVGDGALNDVTVPILLFTAETDEHTPANHADILVRGVRSVPGHAQLEQRVVAGAGPLLLSQPVPGRGSRAPEFPPSQDPEGFDRAAFQPLLAAGERRVLPPGSTSRLTPC